MKKLLCVAMLMGLVLPIAAAEPTLRLKAAEGEPIAKIAAPEKVQTGFPVLLQTEGSSGKAMKWVAFPNDPSVVFLSVLTEEGQRVGLFVSKNPGTFYFALVAASGDKIAVAKHTLVVEDQKPTPPTPDPKPAAKFWTVIVEESGKRIPSQGRVMTSKTVSDWLASHGHPAPWIFDKDARDEKDRQASNIQAYVARAKSFPFLFLVAESGSVLWEGPLPEDEAAMLSLLKKHAGE